MVYYLGEWNGHKIQIENGLKEKLLIDGKEVDINKPGVRLGTVLEAPIPGEDELCCYVLLDGMASLVWLFDDDASDRYCIIGRKLDSTYDKKTNTYRAEYNGHTIVVSNDVESSLSIDGEAADEEKGLRFSTALFSKPDEDGKHIIGVLDGVSKVCFKPMCTIFADAVMVPLNRFTQDKDGNFVPVDM